MFKKFLRPQFVVIVFILLMAAVIGFGQQRANASNRKQWGVVVTHTKTVLPFNTVARSSRTPTRGPTYTPANTNTPTVTRTPGVGCSPVNAIIAAPFTYDGLGETFCWQSTNLGSTINSWNLVTLTINGTNVANIYFPSSSYPTKINGYWYVYLVSGTTTAGHFEAK